MTVPPAALTSNRQDYETPWLVFRHIERFLGVVFVVDFAAADHNAKCPMYYTQDRSAFDIPWIVPAIYPNAAGFCNPPYGDKTCPVRDWVSRTVLPEYNYVFLLPCNKLDQGWVYGLRDRAAWVIITGRISYELGGVPQRGNSRGSVLLCLGSHFMPGSVRYINLKEIT